MRRTRWLLVPIIVVPLTWLLLSGFARDPREVASPLIGRPAPEWTLTTFDGETLSSSDLAGRPYVVNFWASWCIPACVDEHPVLADAFASNSDDVAFVGILYQDDPTAAEGFLARYGDAGYPNVTDPGGRMAIEFGVTGPPETFFVDAAGNVVDKNFGPLTDAVLAEKLDTILPAAGQ